MIRTALTSACAGVLAVAAMAAPAAGQTDVRVLGQFSGLQQAKEIEKPFFETLSEKMGGGFDVEYRAIDEVGLKGFDAIRQLESGIFQIMTVPSGYVSGDAPFFMGMDLPGLIPEAEQIKAAVEAYRPFVDEQFQKRYNGKLLGMWPYPPNIFFCKGPIGGLDDLRGKKVRSYSAPLAALFESFGATAVSLAFSEVYQSLQRGLVDCAITGSLPGYSSKWYEVSDHLYPLPVLWAIQMHVANLDFWNGLKPEQQEKLASLFKEMEARMWETALRANGEGIACNTGGACAYGEPAKMTLVEVTDADRARLSQAAKDVVLPGWAKDCKASLGDCVKIWNETIGGVVGIEAQ